MRTPNETRVNENGRSAKRDTLAARLKDIPGIGNTPNAGIYRIKMMERPTPYLLARIFMGLKTHDATRIRLPTLGVETKDASHIAMTRRRGRRFPMRHRSPQPPLS